MRQRNEKNRLVNGELIIGRAKPEHSTQDGTTKRFNRNLAILAREMVPAELLIEFHLAILQNHDPHIIEDKRTSSGWRVTWNDKGEMRPTLLEKTASINFLRQAGWGMPAQAHYVEADIRSHSGESGLDPKDLRGDVGTTFGLVQALRLVLSGATAVNKQVEEVIEATSEEVVESKAETLTGSED
jgi:hypothetical protein